MLSQAVFEDAELRGRIHIYRSHDRVWIRRGDQGYRVRLRLVTSERASP
jgi:hypothetical protein